MKTKVVNQSDFSLDPGLHTGTFDTSVIKVIRCIPIFDKVCISKMAGRRAKRIEIWASGLSIQCTQGTFDT